MSVITCPIEGMFKLTMFFAKSAANKILDEIRNDIKTLITKTGLIEINTKATNTALIEMFNGEFKEKFDAEKEKLIEDVRFLKDKP